jgi:hypothetical protein
MLQLAPEQKERAAILLVFCEHHGFADWSESLAVREVRKNCAQANREILRTKQQEITKRLLAARTAGEKEEEALLRNEYQEVLKLMKMSV